MRGQFQEGRGGGVQGYRQMLKPSSFLLIYIVTEPRRTSSAYSKVPRELAIIKVAAMMANGA